MQTRPSCSIRDRQEQLLWWLASGLLLAAVVVCVPRTQIGLAAGELRGLIGSYLYETTAQYPTPAVTNLRISDVRYPKTMRLQWDVQNSGHTWQYAAARKLNGTIQATYGGTAKQWDDSFDFASGTGYQYSVQVAPWSDVGWGLPSPPPGWLDASQVHNVYWGDAGPVTSISATPVEVVASENQAVDSRLDLRYSTAHYQDFQFGNNTYRGGLFVGYANDPSRVGRSFLKFELPSADGFWAGSVNGYYTQSVANGSTTVGCQLVNDDWSGTSMVWSTTPSITPTSAPLTQTVSYNSSNPVSGWCTWALNDDICSKFVGNSMASFALASTNESSASWAYFAKKEYDASLAPRLLLAYGASPGLYSVIARPATINGGSTATGLVQFNTRTSGATVSLASDHSLVVQVPSSVTIADGSGAATFQITSSTVTTTTTVKLTATSGTSTVTTTLTVIP